jgi:hypothetical protein
MEVDVGRAWLPCIVATAATPKARFPKSPACYRGVEVAADAVRTDALLPTTSADAARRAVMTMTPSTMTPAAVNICPVSVSPPNVHPRNTAMTGLT